MARNAGWFTPGPDPRRHALTHQERSKGGQTSFAWLMANKPEALLGLRRKLAETRWQWRQRVARGEEG
jgi:hypothetical protein